MKTKRKVYDGILQVITYLASAISVVILFAIIFFIFSKGSKNLSWKFITSDNKEESYIVKSNENNYDKKFENKGNYEFFSNRYGIAFKDSVNISKEVIIEIIYIDPNSPLKEMLLVENGEKTSVNQGFYFTTYIDFTNDIGSTDYIFAREGAVNVATKLDQARIINSWSLSNEGGGIRGSIVTTFYLVILTLAIGLPIGILTAVYLHEIAPRGKFINILRSFIDMLTGIPSIIYGLLGAALLIPVSKQIISTNEIGGNILSGALTLSIMVLPVVIKATESALDVVPKDYKLASLALGANEIQTTFKVILPNALPGILSAALLTIGRVIGESAALIYAIGTVINDNIKISGKGTSLAVHIWSVMNKETPNVEVAASIAIIILAMVLVLNLLVKLISSRLEKKFRG
ncbi:phosphate ABC transporter permease PstA [Haploplasma axanthum]|uniref:Phosphate transport system permease protein PstA n=1 Tax=Haploplasma axanthum TaxID=29552 RepID=A0A449BFR8_HAPAX|nr:phosphate ABC transporter permease PstA [Haploplasma axanthum]VEU81307.1 Phosphate transport system permease protein pstA [Haploplasma axanthum]